MLLGEGIGATERLPDPGWLEERLVLQRAVEEGVADFLQRGWYERTLRALGWRNGAQAHRSGREGRSTLQLALVDTR